MIVYTAIFPFSFMLKQSFHLKLLEQELPSATQCPFSHWSLVTKTPNFIWETKHPDQKLHALASLKLGVNMWLSSGQRWVSRIIVWDFQKGCSNGADLAERSTLLSSNLFLPAPWNVYAMAGALQPFLTLRWIYEWKPHARLLRQNNKMILSLWYPWNYRTTTGLPISGLL